MVSIENKGIAVFWVYIGVALFGEFPKLGSHFGTLK